MLPDIKSLLPGSSASSPLLIAGPCVLESEESAREIAATLKDICRRLDIPLIFKASFDKANRTSLDSFRGPGMKNGLPVLGRIRADFDLPVISDIHESSQVRDAAEVLDIIQIPAFLCRQTDLLVEAGRSGKPVNVKKGQFLSPWDMKPVINKLKAGGCSTILLTERGTFFGYNNLVVDMRSLPIMRSLGHPVIFDATHSVQLPGGSGSSSGGLREFIRPLIRGAVAVGVDGLFMEVHPDPDQALCDGPNSLPLAEVEGVLKSVMAIRESLANN
ncbi:MAG: 3-deoxy-8-phosphooctulonate synthase [Desulfurivibrionaceae bacterium]